MSKYNLTELAEGMGYKEYEDAKEADRLEAHPESAKIKAIQAMMAKEKSEKNEVMGVDRKGNEKEDTDGSDATKYKKAARDMNEDEMSHKDEMKMHLKQYRDGNIDGDDLANAFEEMIMGKVSPPGERGFNTKYGMEESYGVTDQDPEDDVVNVDKVSSPSAKGTNYGGETSSNDNEDNQEDKEIANPKPMYTENGDVDDFADEIAEADPIPTEPGITKISKEDGKEYGVRASNHDRKMAMRNVIDILRDELSVGTNDALDYIRTHKDDLFSGEVDAYDKDEVVADFKEYESVNETSSSDYVDNIKKEKKIDEMESLKEHFNRFM